MQTSEKGGAAVCPDLVKRQLLDDFPFCSDPVWGKRQLQPRAPTHTTPPAPSPLLGVSRGAGARDLWNDRGPAV